MATDKEFTKLLGSHLLNAKGFYDYGVKNGLTTPEDLRLTVSKRQETAKALVNGGMSQRKAAKALGVHHSTVQADLGKAGGKSASNGGKSASGRKRGGPKKSAPIVVLTDEPCADCTTDQERWQRSVMNMAGEAVSLPAYWSQQFGDWKTFPITTDLITLARQAADVWTTLATDLERRKA